MVHRHRSSPLLVGEIPPDGLVSKEVGVDRTAPEESSARAQGGRTDRGGGEVWAEVAPIAMTARTFLAPRQKGGAISDLFVMGAGMPQRVSEAAFRMSRASRSQSALGPRSRSSSS